MGVGIFMRKQKGIFALVKINLKLTGLIALCLILGAGALITAAATAAGADIPVVMYHSVLKDEAMHGRYVISPAELESDLRYLRDHGYTTILIQDLIAYTQGSPLPEKPILLTFDDGYYNNYLYAFPLAQQYGSKFVISPIGKYSDLYTDTPDESAYYSHCTWPQLKEMASSGLVEVQNHSYDLHQSNGGRMGVKKLGSESDAQYKALLANDLQRAQAAITQGAGAQPTAFVYPFGAYSKGTPGIIRELGFQCTLCCEEKISRVTRDPGSLYGLGRFLRPSGISSQAFFEKTMKLGA